jgi:tetratricopeptide (TPR) repeat protein
MAAQLANDRLAEAMRRAGLSNKAFARRIRAMSQKQGKPIACDHTSVSRWLAGTVPRIQTARLIADVLTECVGVPLSLSELGLTASEPVDPGEAIRYGNLPDGAVDVVARLWRADLAEAQAILKSPVVANAWSDVALSWLVQAQGARGETTPVRVGSTDITAVRTTISMFSQLDGTFGGGHARRALIEFLHSDVLPVLQERRPSHIARALYEVAAEGTLLCAWMTYDAGLHGLAQRYFVRALELADEAGERLLGASILDAMSHQATFLGRTHEAANLARAAKSSIRGLDSPSLEAHFDAMEARALAAEGDSPGTQRALSAAARVFERRDPQTDPEWFGYFDDAELSAEFGHCFRDLGRAQDAIAYAERAISGTSPRSDFFVMMVKAVAYLDQPKTKGADPDAACEAASAALQLGRGVKSARCVQYVKDFREKLGPFEKTRVAQDLAEANADCVVWQLGHPATGGAL